VPSLNNILEEFRDVEKLIRLKWKGILPAKGSLVPYCRVGE
jgi:hypothetical protein